MKIGEAGGRYQIHRNVLVALPKIANPVHMKSNTEVQF